MQKPVIEYNLQLSRTHGNERLPDVPHYFQKFETKSLDSRWTAVRDNCHLLKQSPISDNWLMYECKYFSKKIVVLLQLQMYKYLCKPVMNLRRYGLGQPRRSLFSNRKGVPVLFLFNQVERAPTSLSFLRMGKYIVCIRHIFDSRVFKV